MLADLAASTGGECRADGEGHRDDCGLKGYRSIIEHLGISSIGAPPANAPRTCAARILTDAMPNVEPALPPGLFFGCRRPLHPGTPSRRFWSQKHQRGAIEKETIYAEGNHQDGWSRPGTLL